MTGEALDAKVTMLFADSDSAQRRAVCLYAEEDESVGLCAAVGKGKEALRMLRAGLRPEVLVVDAILGDMTIFTFLRELKRLPQEKVPPCIVVLTPGATRQSEKLISLGADNTLFKPYNLPTLFDTVYQTGAHGRQLERYLVRSSVNEQILELGGGAVSNYGINYLYQAMYLTVFTNAAYSLSELCAKVGRPFGVNGSAVRSALERVNSRLHRQRRRAYQQRCLQYGKPPDARLTVSELLTSMTEQVRRDLRL